MKEGKIMRRKLKIIGGMLLLIFSFLILGSSAYAALDLSLGTIKQVDGRTDILRTDLLDVSKNLIDAYYSNPSGRDPRDTTGRLLLAPNITTYNTNAPVIKSDWADPTTKYRAYISGGNYFFTRHTDDDSPGARVYVRVWSSNPNERGGYYSAVSSFDNGTTSTVPGVLNATASYKADVPYQPLITRFEETTTTVLPDRIASATLKVYSAQPSPTDGIREIIGYSWKMGTDRGALSSVSGATSAVLELDSSALTVGQTYYFQVTHFNWFGSADSAIESYTVSGGPAGVVPVDNTYTLNRPTPPGSGINTISIPFVTTDLVNKPITVRASGTDPATGTSLDVDGNGIYTVHDLIRAINAKAGSNVVTVFGWWDKVRQQHIGLTSITGYSGGAGTDVTTATVTGKKPDGTNYSLSEILALPVATGQPYQVSVNTDGVTFTLRGYK